MEECRVNFKQLGINKKIFVLAQPNVQNNFKNELFDLRKLKFKIPIKLRENKIMIIPAAILSSLPKKINTFPRNDAAIPKLMKTKENPKVKIIVLIRTTVLFLSISSSFFPVM